MASPMRTPTSRSCPTGSRQSATTRCSADSVEAPRRALAPWRLLSRTGRHDVPARPRRQRRPGRLRRPGGAAAPTSAPTPRPAPPRPRSCAAPRQSPSSAPRRCQTAALPPSRPSSRSSRSDPSCRSRSSSPWTPMPPSHSYLLFVASPTSKTRDLPYFSALATPKATQTSPTDGALSAPHHPPSSPPTPAPSRLPPRLPTVPQPSRRPARAR